MIEIVCSHILIFGCIKFTYDRDTTISSFPISYGTNYSILQGASDKENGNVLLDIAHRYLQSCLLTMGDKIQYYQL